MALRKVARTTAESDPIPVAGRPVRKRKPSPHAAAVIAAYEPPPDFAAREQRQSATRRKVGKRAVVTDAMLDPMDVPDAEPTDPV